MMFCPNCGKQVKENDKFCRYCGYKLDEELNSDVVSVPYIEYPNKNETSENHTVLWTAYTYMDVLNMLSSQKLWCKMNRETNTSGSKANSLEITNGVISIKTELENIREQIQNIE